MYMKMKMAFMKVLYFPTMLFENEIPISCFFELTLNLNYQKHYVYKKNSLLSKPSSIL